MNSRPQNLASVSSFRSGIQRRSTTAYNTFFGSVIFYEKNDEWHDAIRTKMNALCGLQLGWDGYNGMPSRFDIAEFAASLLERLYNEKTPIPDIVPLADGGIQIEWHVNNIDIEIAINKPLCASVWVEDPRGGVEMEMTNDFSDLIPWIDKLR